MKVAVKEAFDCLDEIRALFLEYAADLECSLNFQDFEAEIANLPYKYSKEEGGCLFVAKIRGEAVGCVAYKDRGGGVCEMKRLYVRPKYRRFGIGKKLAEIAVSRATKAGYAVMYLDTLDTMTNAVSLYEKLGFERTEPYYLNPLPNVIYMKKTLKKDA